MRQKKKKKKVRKKKMMPRQGLKKTGSLPAWSGGGWEKGTVEQQEETRGRVRLGQGVELPAGERCWRLRSSMGTLLRMTSGPACSMCHGKSFNALSWTKRSY